MLPLYRSGDRDVVSIAGRGYVGTASFNDEAALILLNEGCSPYTSLRYSLEALLVAMNKELLW